MREYYLVLLQNENILFPLHKKENQPQTPVNLFSESWCQEMP